MKTSKLFILASLGLVILTGCNGGGGGGGTPAPIDPVVDPTKHLVEGTIHDININYDVTKPFIVNGATDYKIYVVNNDKAKIAANYIKSQILLSTKASIAVEVLNDNQVISSNEKAIVIGSDESFTKAGLAFTDKDLSISGYQLVSKDNAVFIHVKNENGYQMAVLKFLEATIGYDCLYGEYMVYERDGSVIPEMNIVEVPDFDFRKDDDPNTGWRFGAGFSPDNVFMNIGGICYHTSFKYLPPKENSKEDETKTNYVQHPKWYSSNGDQEELTGQLCYTAHGDPDELEKMYELATDKAMEAINANTSMNNLTFTIQDNYAMCKCDHCKEVANQYGGSQAAATLLFANELDNRIQKRLEEQAEAEGTAKREIFLSIFAYHETEVAPCYQDESGKWLGYHDIKCNDHVAIFLAPIGTHFTKSFYETDDPQNALTKTKVESWGAITKHLYCWCYETNFKNYLYPYNSYESMAESYRHLKANNCSLVYPQDEHTNYGRTDFSRLKQYINSKLLVNVNLDISQMIDKFFKYYYDEGGEIMREFYDEMVVWCKYLEKTYPDEIMGWIYEAINNSKYWPENMLRKWIGYCDEALAKIEYLKAKDTVKYDVMKNHIVNESIFPRWALLELYTSSFTDSDLYNERVAFKEDAIRLNINDRSEGGALSDVYAGWGI